MQFRKAKPEDEKEVKALWGYCFEQPDDPYFQWYFRELYHPHEVLVGEENGLVACDLHERPYYIAQRGKTFRVHYIVGVAAHPAARGRGYAKELIRTELRLARKEGHAFSILMPSAASFYHPLGFGFSCFQWHRTASPRDLAAIGKRAVSAGTITSEEDWPMLKAVYDGFVKGRDGYTLRDEASWRSHIRGQLALANSFIAVVKDDKGPSGYLFYTLHDRCIDVQEMAYTSEEGQKGLYFYMASHLGSVDQCSWYEPFDDHSFMEWPNGAEHEYIENHSFPYMMTRIVDPVNAFDGITCDKDVEGVLSFQLVDSFMPENSGLYVLTAENGKIKALRDDVFYTLKLHIEDISGLKLGSRIPEPKFVINAKSLAEWYSGTAPLSVLSREGRIRWLTAKKDEKAETLRAADRMIPAKRTWMNEWY